jgi:hypothetical protein
MLVATPFTPLSVNGQAARQMGRIGVSIPAKDPIAIKLLKVENRFEEMLDWFREPAQKFAHALFNIQRSRSAPKGIPAHGPRLL